MSNKTTGFGEILSSLNPFSKKAAGELPIPEVIEAVSGETTQGVQAIKNELNSIKQDINEVKNEVQNLATEVNPGGSMPEDIKTTTPTPAPEVSAPVPPVEPAPAPEAVGEPKTASTKFELGFKMGEGFNNSFFYAKQGDVIKTVSMHRVIPLDIQRTVLASYKASGKPPENYPGPEIVISQMTNLGVDSMEKFATAMREMEVQANSHNIQLLDTLHKSAKQEPPCQAWNDGEVEKPASVKRGEGAEIAVKDEDGQTKIPGQKIKGEIPKYYSHAYSGSSQTAPEIAINKNSNLTPEVLGEIVPMLRKKVAELQMEADTAKKELSSAKDELKKKDDDAKSKEAETMLSQLVEDLTNKGLLGPDQEQKAIAALVKIDQKELPKVAAFIKLLGKEKGEEDMAPALPPTAKKGPALPPLPESMPKKSSPLPQLYLNDKGIGGVDEAVNFLVKNWNNPNPS